MGQTTGGDAGINALPDTKVSAILAPAALIRGHHIGQSTSHYSDSLHHWLQVFAVWRLAVHTCVYDVLMVAVIRQMAVLTLDVMPI